MASEKILEGKKTVVSEIQNHIDESSSVIFFDYHHLKDAEFKELRRGLRASGSDVKVYKNTLTRIALSNLNLEIKNLTGPKAMAFSGDTIAPIKVLSEFAKKHPALEIKVGIIDKKVEGLETIQSLASVPSREGLLTMLAGGMIATVRDLSIALNMLAEQKEN